MKVLLLDNHPLVLYALQSLIHTLAPQTVVLTADHPRAAFAQLAADPGVDLVLLDLMLGQAVDGFAVLGQLRHHYPALPVVVVSASEQLVDMVRAVDMGAMGFVSKCEPLPDLTEALTMVLAGGVFIPTALLGLARQPGMNLADAAAAADAAASAEAALARAAYSLTDICLPPASPPVLQPMPGSSTPVAAPAAPTGHPASTASSRNGLMDLGLGLTPRQTDVLQWLLKGLPNKLIAREMNLSLDTVKDHVAAVLRGLGVGSRTQAVLVVGQRMQQRGAGAGVG